MGITRVDDDILVMKDTREDFDCFDKNDTGRCSVVSPLIIVHGLTRHYDMCSTHSVHGPVSLTACFPLIYLF